MFRQVLGTAERVTSILAVSVYLTAVGCFLIVTVRVRISPRGLARAILASLRPPFSGDLIAVTYEKGHCYVALLGKRLISDADGGSGLVLFEDGQALPYPHSIHEDIRERGAGRYSHWGDAVFFSSSDNTDPSTNGRRYSVREV